MMLPADSGLPFADDRRNLLALALICAVLFLAPLPFLELAGGDETRVAGIAAEAAVSGDLLTPKLNGKPFLEYPPLCYALEAASCRLFGFTPFAVKLPAALAAFAGVLMLYAMMRSLRRTKWEAFGGAFMLATGAQYLANATNCRVDMVLAAFCILAWWGFAAMEFSGGGAAKRLGGMALLSAGIAGGVLTKNLPGAAIPLSGAGCALLFTDLAKKRFSFAAYCRVAAATACGLAPFALYLWSLYEANGAEAVETMLFHNNFGRFSGANRDHSAPCWYYLWHLPEQFHPYLPLLLAGFWLRCRGLFRRRSARSILLLSLIAVPFAMLSVASGKRQIYLLPLAAPAALIAASALPWGIRFCRRFRRGAAALEFCRRRRRLLLGAAVLLSALVSGTVAGYISRRDSFAPVFAEAERLRRGIPGGRLVLIRPSERLAGAAFFYRRAVTPELADWKRLKRNDIALAPLRAKHPLPPLPAGFAARRFPQADLVLVAALPTAEERLSGARTK